VVLTPDANGIDMRVDRVRIDRTATEVANNVKFTFRHRRYSDVWLILGPSPEAYLPCFFARISARVTSKIVFDRFVADAIFGDAPTNLVVDDTALDKSLAFEFA